MQKHVCSNRCPSCLRSVVHTSPIHAIWGQLTRDHHLTTEEGHVQCLLLWAWQSDLGPTANLLAAYLNAMTRASLEPLCIMLAMQMRPLSSWSATFRNLSRGLEILEWKVPSRSTVELAFSNQWRGIRTSADSITASNTVSQPSSHAGTACRCAGVRAWSL